MTGIIEFPVQRLTNQRLAGDRFNAPAEVVGWLGGLQAQDYLGALWAIGLRMQHATEAGIEQALAGRSIVRTWPMRGTLHFVAAQDVRWMLALIAPRVIARSARRYRELGLEEQTFSRSREIVAKVMQGGNQLTRGDLYQVLEAAQISTAGQRGIHILGRLTQEGLICFGAREGKQQTFVLLDEWIPPTKPLARLDALAELTRRYFTSHGPATLQDYVWWSGLTTADAKVGLEMAQPYLAQEDVKGKIYWLSESAPVFAKPIPAAHLLPAFDEYLVGYKVRDAVLNPRFVKQTNAGGGMLSPVILLGGQVAGTWKRTLKKGAVEISPSWFLAPGDAQKQALIEATERYGAFLKLPTLMA
jgi:hypothetical protein